jgi:hypothetical protein
MKSVSIILQNVSLTCRQTRQSSVALQDISAVILRPSEKITGLHRSNTRPPPSALLTVYFPPSLHSNLRNVMDKELITKVKLIFRVITPCKPVGRCQRFGERQRFHLQGEMHSVKLASTDECARRQNPVGHHHHSETFKFHVLKRMCAWYVSGLGRIKRMKCNATYCTVTYTSYKAIRNYPRTVGQNMN